MRTWIDKAPPANLPPATAAEKVDAKPFRPLHAGRDAVAQRSYHPAGVSPKIAPGGTATCHNAARTAQRTVPTIEKIETLEAAMLKLPQVDCPVTNLFAPGIYWREIEIPAGAVALGHKHKTEHLNVLLSGRVRVLCDGQVKELVAPLVFSSPAGVRKLVYAVEPSRWANVHANPTDETDMAKLEVIFIEKSGGSATDNNAGGSATCHNAVVSSTFAKATVDMAPLKIEH